MAFLSVIVPIYNTSKYLERCLNSLVAQTFRDMEIILIDDGSFDASSIICDRYVSAHPYIKCIHKANGGLSSARNAGLDVASGEYIAFVDSDDFASPEMFEKLCSAADGCYYDIVYCASYNSWTKRNGGILSYSFDEIIRKQSIWKCLADMTASSWESDIPVVRNMAVWGAIFKREILKNNNVRFRSERDYLSEDYLFDYELFSFVSNIRYIPEPLYFYCLNEQSLSTTFAPSKVQCLDSLISFISKQRIVQENKALAIRILKLDIYYSFLLLGSLAKCRLSREEKKRMIRIISSKSIWRHPYLIEHYLELGPSFQEMVNISRQDSLFTIRLMLFKRRILSIIFRAKRRLVSCNI